MPVKLLRLILTVAAATVCCAAKEAGDWPRFRGPNGSGVSQATGLPIEFNRSQNLLWKAAVPPGHSSPVLPDNRAQWKAGVAEIDITPETSVWMAGYAARNKPSEGTAQDLHAKALALEDSRGKRAVLITADLLGFPRETSAHIAEQLRQKHHLPRDAVLFNASHTHGGPVVRRTLAVAYDLNPEQWSAIEDYTRQLEEKIAAVVEKALQNLAPARVKFGRSSASFAKNRRELRDGRFVGGTNPAGPVDHDVPVLRVEKGDGGLLAVVFQYACHNTTVGADMVRFHGDYTGWAQQWLQNKHPGAIAMFMAGCGADANPSPRGTMELARQHGEALAQSVEAAMQGPMKVVQSPLTMKFEEFPVDFARPPGRGDFEQKIKTGNVYERRHAQEMLRIMDRDGRLPNRYPYSVQVWKFGPDLTMIALAGEVVVDYVLRLKRELGSEKLWVAGYSNDVFAYIPSLRILQEGGYEGGGAMIYYVQPGPFAPSIEETIIGRIHQMIDRMN
jgi:hypothetical protein